MDKIQAHFSEDSVFSNSHEAYTLYEKSNFGEKSDGKIIYSLAESLFLVEKQKMRILWKNKPVLKDELFSKFKKIDKRINVKYPVFRDLRNKGYVVKTALKFGADFRVYEKGSKPGNKHSSWIVFADNESKSFSWQEFSSKNRTAHSTKKKLLVAVVDEEQDVTYYESSWIKM